MKYAIVAKEDLKTKEVKEKVLKEIKLTYDEKNPDLVIALGGDGTIIKAIHKYPKATTFGLHTGHLGFYANYGVSDLEILINDINNNEFKVNETSLISCEIETLDGKKIFDNAINEITIVTPLRTMMVDVLIDDIFFERYRGTGLCISTPTGSTAYNKSLNGSVIDSSLNVMQLTEIAGINSNAYRTLSSPIVLDGKRTIKLASGAHFDDVFITVDHISYDIKNFKSLYIKYKGESVKMAYHKYEGFLERINRTFLVSKD